MSLLRGRFGLVLRLDPYSVAELHSIVKRSAKLLNVEIEDGAGVWPGVAVEQKLAGHPQVDGQHTAIQRQYDELSVAAHGMNALIADAPGELLKILANHEGRRKMRMHDAAACELGRKRSDHRLDFRKLGHQAAASGSI